MRAVIGLAQPEKVRELISQAKKGKLSEYEERAFDACLTATTMTWSGCIDDKLICVWGLVPPTLLSDSAYLWLYHTENVKNHEFLFIRYSQRAVEEMLTLYPTIRGHVLADASKSIRWLKWLGAKLGEPDAKLIPFTIRSARG